MNPLKPKFSVLSALLCCLMLGCAPRDSGPAQPLPGRPIFYSAGFFNSRRIDYQIDRFLNLKATRQIRLTFSAEVLDLSNENVEEGCETEPARSCGRLKLKPLRTGFYLLRYGIVRNGRADDPETHGLVSTGEKIIEVATGKIVTDLSIDIPDMRLMASRNSLLLEITMIREDRVRKVGASEYLPLPGFSFQDLELSNGNLAQMIFETPLDPANTGRLTFSPFELKLVEPALQRQIQNYRPWLAESHRSLIENKMSLANMKDLMAADSRLKHLMELKNQSQKDNFVQVQNLIAVDSQESRAGKISASLVRANQNGNVDSELYAELCALWYRSILPDLHREFASSESLHLMARAEFVNSCVGSRSPGLSQLKFFRRFGARYTPFFVFENVLIVDEASYKGIQPPGRNFSVQIGDQFYVRARTEYNYEAGLRPLSWIPIVGPYLSLAGVMAIDVSLKEDTGNQLRFSTNMTLNVEENTMAVELRKYKRCLMVRMNPAWTRDLSVAQYTLSIKDPIRQDQFSRALRERGLFACDRTQTNPVLREEKYFYLSTGREAGVQQDPTDLRNRQISLPLRGDRDFLTFMEAGKSQLLHSELTDSRFGLHSWLGGVEQALFAVPSATSGIFLEKVFY